MNLNNSAGIWGIRLEVFLLQDNTLKVLWIIDSSPPAQSHIHIISVLMATNTARQYADTNLFFQLQEDHAHLRD